MSEVPNQGRYLVQVGTNRVYVYTDELAERMDMLLFNNGKQIPNPKRGGNRFMPVPPSQDASERDAVVSAEMDIQLNALKDENENLRKMIEQLTSPKSDKPSVPDLNDIENIFSEG